MTTIRALVLAQLEQGPKTMNELLEAIDEIENPRQLSNCLYKLRTTGAVTRDDDRRYHIAPADDAAPASNPIVDAITRMPAPAVDNSYSSLARDYNGTYRSQRQELSENVEEADRVSKRIIRAAIGTVGPQSPIRAILERSVEANQAALDDYLASVADPRILGPLRNARDEARAALAALDNAGSPSC